MGAAPIPNEAFFRVAEEVGNLLVQAGATDVIISSRVGSFHEWTAESSDFRLEIMPTGVYSQNSLEVQVKMHKLGADARLNPDPISLSEFIDLFQMHQFERAEHAMSHGAISPN